MHFCANCSEVALVLELVEGMTLKNFILQGPVVPIEQRLKLTQGISSALRYLHSRQPKVVHGDLKDGNIFVENIETQPTAKLLDFGISRQTTLNSRTLGGTLNWTAPEILLDGNLLPSASSDVFSFGHIFFFVLTRMRPLNFASRSDATHMLRSGTLPQVQFPLDSFDTKCYEPLVCACTHVDPSVRPSMLKVNMLLSGTWSQHERRTRADWHDALVIGHSESCIAHSTKDWSP